MRASALSLLRSEVHRTFQEHPATLGESYLEHLAAASHLAGRLIAAGTACLLHALVPRLCRDSASSAVQALHLELERRVRSRRV